MGKKPSLKIKNDSKSLFAYSRSRTRNKVHVGPVYGNSGSMTASDFEMVNSFNGHFASVFTTEDISSIPTPSVSSVPSHNTFSDVNITQHYVLQGLSKLRVDKAAGPDEVSARLLIEIKDNIVYPLFVIFWKSLDEGVVPDDWKSAKKSCVQEEQ